MAKLALFVALLGLLAHSCTAQQSCTETFSRCCRQLGKPTRFKGKIVDLDGKRIGSATFCFTGTQNAPTSGFTRTRINGRGRKIRSGLRVDIGYIGPPPTTELTLAQSDNFTPVGIPPVVTPPLQEPPSSTILGVTAAALITLPKAGCSGTLGNRSIIGLIQAIVTIMRRRGPSRGCA